MSLASILGAVWLGLWRITGPLRDLVEVAKGLRLDADLPAMPRGCPREVQALPDELARIHRRRASMMKADRTRMLAALAYARGVSAEQPMKPVDLNKMLRDLAEVLADAGEIVV